MTKPEHAVRLLWNIFQPRCEKSRPDSATDLGGRASNCASTNNCQAVDREARHNHQLVFGNFFVRPFQEMFDLRPRFRTRAKR